MRMPGFAKGTFATGEHESVAAKDQRQAGIWTALRYLGAPVAFSGSGRASVKPPSGRMRRRAGENLLAQSLGSRAAGSTSASRGELRAGPIVTAYDLVITARSGSVG